MYEVRAYFDYDYKGLEDNFGTSDFDLAVDFAHDKLMQGYNVTIENLTSGIKKEILSDYYHDNFNGDFIYKYTDFEEVI